MANAAGSTKRATPRRSGGTTMELQLNYVGIGSRDEVVTVEDPDLAGLLVDNEHGIEVKAGDVEGEPTVIERDGSGSS